MVGALSPRLLLGLTLTLLMWPATLPASATETGIQGLEEGWENGLGDWTTSSSSVKQDCSKRHEGSCSLLIEPTNYYQPFYAEREVPWLIDGTVTVSVFFQQPNWAHTNPFLEITFDDDTWVTLWFSYDYERAATVTTSEGEVDEFAAWEASTSWNQGIIVIDGLAGLVRASFRDFNGNEVGASDEHELAETATRVQSIRLGTLGLSMAAAKINYDDLAIVIDAPATIAGFYARVESLINGEPIQLIDASLAASGARLVAWSWTFGAEGNSSTQNPVWTFTTGTYLVCLTVQDDLGAQATSCVDVEIRSRPPTASWTMNPANPRTLEPVQFLATGTDPDGMIVDYVWDLDDGVTASGPSASRTFPDNGWFQVCLIVTDNDGESAASCDGFWVANRPPLATFSMPAPPLHVNANITFQDMATDLDGEVVAWTWSFDGNLVHNTRKITRQYTVPGWYTATLIVRDDDGTFGQTSKSFEIINSPPVAEFSFPGLVSTWGAAQFIDLSTDEDSTIVSWKWSFGDGSTSTLQSPSHHYSKKGAYPVTLAVTDDLGTTGTKTATVTVLPVIMHARAWGADTPDGGLADTRRVTSEGEDHGYGQAGGLDQGIMGHGMESNVYTRFGVAEGEVLISDVWNYWLGNEVGHIEITGLRLVAEHGCAGYVSQLDVARIRIEDLELGPFENVPPNTVISIGDALTIGLNEVDRDEAGFVTAHAVHIGTPAGRITVGTIWTGVENCT